MSRPCRVIELNGERRTVPEWAKVVGISESAMYVRLARGWTIEAALTVGPQEHHAQAVRAAIRRRAARRYRVRTARSPAIVIGVRLLPDPHREAR